MLTKVLSSILFFSIYIGSANSQAPSIQWQFCYGNLGHDEVWNAQQTTDGGYILCGLTGNSLIDENCWIVKLNPGGGVVWQTVIGGGGKDRAVDIKQTVDGGYIVGGYTDSNDGDFSSNHGNKDYWVAKLNSAGGIVWQKLFGGNADEILRSIQQTADGGFIISGSTTSGAQGVANGDITFTYGSESWWIIKLDALGNISWQRCYGGGSYSVGFSIKQTPDGGYIAVGSIGGDNNDFLHSKAWILKLTGTGDIIWQKIYGTMHGGDFGIDICLLTDGNYGVAALSEDYNNDGGDVTDNHGTVDYWVLKLSITGNLIWQRSLGGCCSDNMTRINATPDGGMVGVGFEFSGNTGNITGTHGSANSDYWVVKLSSEGSLLWQKALGGNSVDYGYYVAQTSDLGYIVAGYTDSNNSGDVGVNPNPVNFHAGWVVKLMPDPLPVTLVDFEANVKGQDILCTWKTLQEQNSSYFTIERSSNALHFNSIENVIAAGNSSLTREYNFKDNGAGALRNDYLYYRLKLVDLDSSFKYSNVVKIKLNFVTDLSIYPNPASDQLKICFASASTRDGVLNITDLEGKIVYNQPIKILKGNNSYRVDIRLLQAGSYIATLNAEKKYAAIFFKLSK